MATSATASARAAERVDLDDMRTLATRNLEVSIQESGATITGKGTTFRFTLQAVGGRSVDRASASFRPRLRGSTGGSGRGSVTAIRAAGV